MLAPESSGFFLSLSTRTRSSCAETFIKASIKVVRHRDNPVEAGGLDEADGVSGDSILRAEVAEKASIVLNPKIGMCVTCLLHFFGCYLRPAWLDDY